MNKSTNQSMETILLKGYKNNSNVRPRWQEAIKFASQNNCTWKWNQPFMIINN